MRCSRQSTDENTHFIIAANKYAFRARTRIVRRNISLLYISVIRKQTHIHTHTYAHANLPLEFVKIIFSRLVDRGESRL